MEVENTGEPIKAPVGQGVLGRMLNVIGEPIDELGEIKDVEYWPIHRPAPSMAEQNTEINILETGLKVIDLLAPFPRGGKIGFFGGAGVRKNSSCYGNDQKYRHRAPRFPCLRVLVKEQEKEMTFTLI